MRFTDKGIAALKPRKSRYEVWDGGRAGFGCRITPRGVRTFIWLYRFDGRPRRMSFGTYPAISLADARLKAAEARKLLERGVDPGAVHINQRRAEREAATVAVLVEEYLDRYVRPRKRSAAEDERMLRKDVLPAWSSRKAKDITRKDVIALLDRVVERGAPIGANRLLACIRRMYNWAISRDILPANPCAMVQRPGRENRRERVLSAAEIRDFWHGLDRAAMSETVRLALRFQLATAQRKGEVVAAEWVDIDHETAVWTIPPEKSKNRMAHRVPLSRLSLELLDTIAINGNGSRWLCPSPRGDKPIAPGSVDFALRRDREVISIPDITPHDLRRSAASHMTSSGISRLVVSKLLNHVESGVTAVYDRHSYDAEKRRALDAWGARLQEIVGKSSEAADKVVSLR